MVVEIVAVAVGSQDELWVLGMIAVPVKAVAADASSCAVQTMSLHSVLVLSGGYDAKNAKNLVLISRVAEAPC